jgi:phage terminase Nu1 subunit (DNA packaging protein)
MAKPVNVRSIAQLLKLTERRVQQLVQDGVLPRPQKRMYDPVICVHAYIDYLRKLATGAGEMSLTDERTRLTKLQADLAEIDLRKATGEMISTRKAMLYWGKVVASVRQRLLGLPTRLAPVVSSRSVQQVKERLEVAIHEVLQELSNPDLVRLGKQILEPERVDLFTSPGTLPGDEVATEQESSESPEEELPETDA